MMSTQQSISKRYSFLVSLLVLVALLVAACGDDEDDGNGNGDNGGGSSEADTTADVVELEETYSAEWHDFTVAIDYPSGYVVDDDQLHTTPDDADEEERLEYMETQELFIASSGVVLDIYDAADRADDFNDLFSAEQLLVQIEPMGVAGESLEALQAQAEEGLAGAEDGPQDVELEIVTLGDSEALRFRGTFDDNDFAFYYLPSPVMAGRFTDIFFLSGDLSAFEDVAEAMVASFSIAPTDGAENDPAADESEESSQEAGAGAAEASVPEMSEELIVVREGDFRFAIGYPTGYVTSRAEPPFDDDLQFTSIASSEAALASGDDLSQLPKDGLFLGFAFEELRSETLEEVLVVLSSAVPEGGGYSIQSSDVVSLGRAEYARLVVAGDEINLAVFARSMWPETESDDENRFLTATFALGDLDALLSVADAMVATIEFAPGDTLL